MEYAHLNLADLSSIRRFVQHVLDLKYTVSVLVNNAAVWAPAAGSKTDDGLDLSFGVNYVGPFYLTNLLIPILRLQEIPCHIINIGCGDYARCPAIDLNYVSRQARLLTAAGSLLVSVDAVHDLPAIGTKLAPCPYVGVLFRGAAHRTQALRNTPAGARASSSTA